jgi:hypothetical protein
MWVEDLEETDRPAAFFRDELLTPVERAPELGLPVPVIVRIRLDHVRLLVPVSQQLHVVRGRGAQLHRTDVTARASWQSTRDSGARGALLLAGTVDG